MRGKWNEDNISILLELDSKAKGYDDLLNNHIGTLIQRLQKEPILTFLNASYLINQFLSEKIISEMRGKWNEDNISILLELDSKAKGYDDLLNNHIGTLIQRLQKEPILTFLNANYLINQFLSEKIMSEMSGKWNEDNISILLRLD